MCASSRSPAEPSDPAGVTAPPSSCYAHAREVPHLRPRKLRRHARVRNLRPQALHRRRSAGGRGADRRTRADDSRSGRERDRSRPGHRGARADAARAQGSERRRRGGPGRGADADRKRSQRRFALERRSGDAFMRAALECFAWAVLAGVCGKLFWDSLKPPLFFWPLLLLDLTLLWDAARSYRQGRADLTRELKLEARVRELRRELGVDGMVGA